MTSADAYGSELNLKGSCLRVTAKGRIGRGALGADERTIELTDVTALSFESAGMLTNGKLELVDPNGKTLVHFRRKHNDGMRALFERISEQVPPAALSASTDAALVNEDRDAWTREKRAAR